MDGEAGAVSTATTSLRYGPKGLRPETVCAYGTVWCRRGLLGCEVWVLDL